MNEVLELKGFDELQKLFELLPYKLTRTFAISAFRKIGGILVKAIRRRIKKRSGTLYKSIGIVVDRSSSAPAVLIGPRTKRMGYRGKHDAWYAHFIEFGVSGIGKFATGVRSRGKNVRAPRRYRADQPAKPFMRPAYDETRQQMIDDFAGEAGKVINKFIEKRAPKYYA